MNRLMLYGGVSLAVFLFILAVLFFIIFKIPSAHRYFKKNRKKGLVEAAVVEQGRKQASGPKRVTRAEYEDRTRIISIGEGQNGWADMDATGYLMYNGPDDADMQDKEGGETEILGQTELLR